MVKRIAFVASFAALVACSEGPGEGSATDREAVSGVGACENVPTAYFWNTAPVPGTWYAFGPTFTDDNGVHYTAFATLSWGVISAILWVSDGSLSTFESEDDVCFFEGGPGTPPSSPPGGGDTRNGCGCNASGPPVAGPSVGCVSPSWRNTIGMDMCGYAYSTSAPTDSTSTSSSSSSSGGAHRSGSGSGGTGRIGTLQ